MPSGPDAGPAPRAAYRRSGAFSRFPTSDSTVISTWCCRKRALLRLADNLRRRPEVGFFGPLVRGIGRESSTETVDLPPLPWMATPACLRRPRSAFRPASTSYLPFISSPWAMLAAYPERAPAQAMPSTSRAQPAARPGSARRCCAGTQARCVPAPPSPRAKASAPRRATSAACGNAVASTLASGLQSNAVMRRPRRRSRCRRRASRSPAQECWRCPADHDFGVSATSVVPSRSNAAR